MRKPIKQCCRTCCFAKWNRNAAGARIIANGLAECTYPLPPLPDSLQIAFGRKPSKGGMFHTQGAFCATWKEGTYDG